VHFVGLFFVFSQENVCKMLLVSIQIRVFSIIPEIGYHFDNSS